MASVIGTFVVSIARLVDNDGVIVIVVVYWRGGRWGVVIVDHLWLCLQ